MEKARLLEEALGREGRLAMVEALIQQTQNFERNFVSRVGPQPYVANARMKHASSEVPTATARRRKEAERVALQEELAMLEAKLESDRLQKERIVAEVASPKGKHGGGMYARKSSNVTKHAQIPGILLDRKGGYTTFSG